MVDPRIERTKRDFRNSLKDLLRNKKLNEVSVKELCIKAKYTRSAFYSHYKNVSDVIDDIKKDFIDRIEPDVCLFNEGNRDYLISIFKNEYETVLILLEYTDIEDGLYRLTLKQAKEVFPQSRNTNSRILEIVVSYLVSGTIKIFKNCLGKNSRLSDNDVSSILYSLNMRVLSIPCSDLQINK